MSCFCNPGKVIPFKEVSCGSVCGKELYSTYAEAEEVFHFFFDIVRSLCNSHVQGEICKDMGFRLIDTHLGCFSQSHALELVCEIDNGRDPAAYCGFCS